MNRAEQYARDLAEVVDACTFTQAHDLPAVDIFTDGQYEATQDAIAIMRSSRLRVACDGIGTVQYGILYHAIARLEKETTLYLRGDGVTR